MTNSIGRSRRIALTIGQKKQMTVLTTARTKQRNALTIGKRQHWKRTISRLRSGMQPTWWFRTEE